MATNTGIRKCKKCQKEFVKRHSLDSYCSYECASAGKKVYPTKPKYIDKKAIYPVKKTTPIKKESSKNKCKCSDGTYIAVSLLNKLITAAKKSKSSKMMEEYGYVFCEDCMEFGVPPGVNQLELKIFDHSHEISVDECKKSGRSELAADVNNIRMRCRYHHRKHDKTL